MADRSIVAIGGWPWCADEEIRCLQRFILSVARGSRILYVPTAHAEDADTILQMHGAWRGLGEVSHLAFFPWPPAHLREYALAHDVILVGGGNTANMLAVWRVHGFDAILREAWESGVVLAGWSAGMICWFEAGVTDSFGPQLEGMHDGLRFLDGSACPHYDAEERRRPVYRELVDGGFPGGYAADDGVALRFSGTEIVEAVSCRAGGRAYRVERGSEEPLETRLLA